jgi:hypothetical protein
MSPLGCRVEYFVSKNHDMLNGRPFAPEKSTPRVCLNPKYPVSLSSGTRNVYVLLDSGAFQDLKATERLSPRQALNRQLDFERRVGFESKFIVSYDRIVDESPTVQGHKRKRRVDSTLAGRYVDQTIDAAKFLADNREGLTPRRLVLSNQGVTVEQYVDCVKEILRFSEPTDVVGLGGFCIIGQVPKYSKDYFAVVKRILPMLRRRKIRRMHVFGVGVFKTLIKTHVMCSRFGVIPSYDTSSLELNAVFGRVFRPDLDGVGPSGVHLTTVFDKDDKYRYYHPRDWALINLNAVNALWRSINHFHPLPKDYLTHSGRHTSRSGRQSSETRTGTSESTQSIRLQHTGAIPS